MIPGKTNLLKVIKPLRGLYSYLEELEDPSHDVNDGGGDLRRGPDVADVSVCIFKHEGLHKLSSDEAGEFRWGVVAIFTREAVVFSKSQIRHL